MSNRERKPGEQPTGNDCTIEHILTKNQRQPWHKWVPKVAACFKCNHSEGRKINKKEHTETISGAFMRMYDRGWP